MQCWRPAASRRGRRLPKKHGAAADQAGQPVEDADVAKAEVELDQETYDRLIAEGKSERIARSKAKAAFVKKQRAAGGDTASADAAGTDTQPSADPSAEQAQAQADGAVGPTEADEVAAEVDEAAEAAAVKAEEVRKAQAEARAARAAEQADAADDGDDDGPVIPEGTPPEDDGEDQG